MGIDYYWYLGKTDKGGGIVCLYKNELNVTKVQPPFEIKSMEFMETLLMFE